MKSLRIAAAFLCIVSFYSCSLFRSTTKTTEQFPLVNSRQLVIVVSNGWDDASGELQYFERPSQGDDWKKVGSKASVELGRTGLAWGTGLNGNSPGDLPLKHEGDGKSPAGVFKISAVFGYAPVDSAPAFKMPYVYLTSCMQCVDDINSVYYNFIIDSCKTKGADWKSFEKMRTKYDFYKWGAVIDHNKMPREKGGGSCIFLHVWGGQGKTTSGCTALNETKLLEILKWLDASKNPVIVQLPKPEYERLKNQWQLPSEL